MARQASNSGKGDDADAGSRGGWPGEFRTTCWSIVLRAQQGESAEALETLCRNYWRPLYGYARRRGKSQHDAEDLTQDFFSRLLEKEYLQAVRREKGPFRAFLLTAFQRFLSNARASERRLKRGGGRHFFSLDSALAERLHGDGRVEQQSDEALYEREWALTLLERALHKLRDEFGAAGQLRQFDLLKPCLAAVRGNIVYAEVAARLDVTEGAARVAVYRLRKRFRHLLQQEVSQTVLNASQLEAELTHLMQALSTK